MWGSAEPIQNGSREHTKYKIHVLKVISASAGESINNFSLQIKVCVALSRAHSHGHTYARTQIYCRYSSKQVALTPSVYCAVLIFIYVNCVMVTGEALQLVSQTSTEKEMSRKTRRRKREQFIPS